MLSPVDLRGWLPASIVMEAGRPVVTWRPVGSTRFTEPFFDDALRVALSDPRVGTRRHRTGIAMLPAVAEEPGVPDGPQPSGFIFHWSRCGSTLVSQMLAAHPDHLAISEAPPVDFVLGGRTGARREVLPVDYLRWLLRIFARAVPDRRRLYVKFDSWQVLLWRRIREAFPGVPAIFVYREPLEVLVSHERLCGSQMLPLAIDPELSGWESAEVLQRPLEVHWAMVLAALGEAGLAAAEAGGVRLVNYSELPEVVFDRLLPWFGVPPESDSLAAMRAVSRLHAKHPAAEFIPDSESKRSSASPSLIDASRQFVSDIHGRLETARRERFGLAMAGFER